MNNKKWPVMAYCKNKRWIKGSLISINRGWYKVEFDNEIVSFRVKNIKPIIERY